MTVLVDGQNSIVEMTALWKTFKLVVEMRLVEMKWIISQPSLSCFKMKMMRVTRLLEMTLMMN